MREVLVGAEVGPDGEQAEFVAVWKPDGDLFDGGLFEIVGERGLAGGGRAARQNVAAGVGHTGGRRKAKG